MDDESPELRGYEPHGDRPLRSERTLRAMRVVVILGLAGLVLPGILITAFTAANSAERACAYYVAQAAPAGSAPAARFELTGPEGPGWNCYAERGGREQYVRGMGLIPVAPPVRRVPSVPAENT